MNRLMKLEKRPALPMSIRQIRYLVYLFVGCFLTLVLLSWAILLKYRLHEALDRQEILFRSQAEQLQSNLHTAEGMTLRAQGVLARLFEVGMEKPLASINTPQWVSRLQRRGDRQYMSLPVSAGHQAIPAGEQLSTLADMLSFTFRVNNVQYRNVQNAYLFDVHADRFYVIPRRYGPARQLLGNDEAYQRFLGETCSRLRDSALMNRLYAAPDKVVMLEPTRDWASGVRVVTLVALVQLDGNPAAVLALDFPLSVVFPEARQTTERLALLTRDGTPLLRDDDAGPSSDRLLARALAERTSGSTASQPVFIRDGLLLRAALLEYPLDAWGWRVVDVVGVQALWGHFRENTMWLLCLTGLSCILMLAWVRLVDRRIMRPTQMQSKRLQESETLGRTVIQSAGVGLMIVERDGGEVLLANDAARRIAEHALPEDVKRLYQECSKALATREAGADATGPLRFAFKLAKDHGQDCHLEVLLVETTYRGRAALLCALNDISAAKQSEARLLEAIRAADAASRAKSSFLAMMSHEIRTPLNGMLGSIELLGLTPLEPRQRDQLAVMQQAAQSLIGIINDVLDFSKIEAEQMSVQPRPCLIDELVEDVTRRFAVEATRKNLRLLCAVDPSLTGPILLDPLKVEQVLSNLVSNAVKFTEQGKVVVSVSKLDGPEPSLQIRVIDTGIGIAEETSIFCSSPLCRPSNRIRAATGARGWGFLSAGAW
ncbi:hypothetical protein AWV80_40200 [Cupriavidus sp. UYMU48A]|nr:hypothetical protein AWV80_40200 [Cupriavidus sp. UYMU48A]